MYQRTSKNTEILLKSCLNQRENVRNLAIIITHLLTPYPPTHAQVTNTALLTVSNPASCSNDAATLPQRMHRASHGLSATLRLLPRSCARRRACSRGGRRDLGRGNLQRSLPQKATRPCLQYIRHGSRLSLHLVDHLSDRSVAGFAIRYDTKAGFAINAGNSGHPGAREWRLHAGAAKGASEGRKAAARVPRSPPEAGAWAQAAGALSRAAPGGPRRASRQTRTARDPTAPARNLDATKLFARKIQKY